MLDSMKAAYADDRIYSSMSGGAKRNMEKLYHDAQIYDQHLATLKAAVKSQPALRDQEALKKYVQDSFATIRAQVERNANNLNTLEASRQLNVPR